MLQLSKKEFELFKTDIPEHIERLAIKLREKKTSFTLGFDFESISVVEQYFAQLKEMTDENVFEFWAYIGTCVMEYVGGIWKLAPKLEDVSFTPIIVDFGFKQKWRVRISPEVWREKLLSKTLPFSLRRLIENMNSDYGRE